MTGARHVSEATAATLLDAIAEGGLAPGVASDVARQIVELAATRGVPFDELLELIELGSRR